MASEFHITFADVPFRSPHPAIVERLERFGWPRDLFPEKILPGPALQRIGFPDPLPYPAPRLNQWFYPTGASRSSVFRGVMDADQLAAVKEVVWASADTQAAGTFSIKSVPPEAATSIENDVAAFPGFPVVTSNEITTSLFLLSAFPMSVEGVSLYLVTLVDERYYFHQMHNGGVINGVDGPTETWEEVIDQLVSNLGITLNYNPPSAAYGFPELDSPLYSNYENPAVLLDMAAANIGGVVCRGFGGSYGIQRWSDAVTYSVDNRTAVTAFGGEFVADASDDYRSMMPANIMVVFPKWVDDVGYYEPTDNRGMFKDSYGATWTKTNALTDLGAPYSTYANNGLTKVLHTAFRARFDAAGDPDPNNLTECEALAALLAKDYLDARTVWIDESYRGIRNRTIFGASLLPFAVSDFVFCFDGVGVYTRAIAPPLNEGYHNFQHGPVQGGISNPNFTIEEVDGSPSVVQPYKLQLPNDAMSSPSNKVARLLEASRTTAGTVNLTSFYVVQKFATGTKGVDALGIGPFTLDGGGNIDGGEGFFASAGGSVVGLWTGAWPPAGDPNGSLQLAALGASGIVNAVGGFAVGASIGASVTTGGLTFVLGIYTGGTFSGATLPIDLTTDVTGVLPEANGGTNQTTFLAALQAAGGATAAGGVGG